MYKYCFCGAPNGATANFCQKCGEKFVDLSKATQTNKPTFKSVTPAPAKSFKKITPKVQEQEEVVDEEGDDFTTEVTSVPDIQDFQFEIFMKEPDKVTVGQLMSTGDGKIEPIKNAKITKKDQKSIMEQYKSEAGSIKPKK